MKRRIITEMLLGTLLIAGFVWGFYFRPEPQVVSLDEPQVSNGILSNREKVLIIGVDGMTWSVALELMNQGRMPNLVRLFSESPHGLMFSEPPLISPAIWTTFATGHKRSVHGIDNFLSKLPHQYKPVSMTSKFRRVPALWNIASWAGRTVGVINWNAAFPAEEVNGVFVASDIKPGKMTNAMIYPPEWQARVSSLMPVTFAEMEESLTQMEGSQARRAYDHDRFVFTVAREVLSEMHPDLMMVYFTGVDVVSHIYWKYRRPLDLGNYFQISQKEKDLYGEVIDNHYEFTDSLLGGLLREAEDYTIVIISDHGMGPHYSPNNYYLILNRLLERTGYLHYADKSCDTILAELCDEEIVSVPAPLSVNIFSLCQILVAEAQRRQNDDEPVMSPEVIEELLKPKVAILSVNSHARKVKEDKMRALAKAVTPGSLGNDILWSNTLAWNMEDTHKKIQGVFINLRGRDPEGAVAVEQYRLIRKRIIATLRKLRTEKGKPLFISVEPNHTKNATESQEPEVPDILVEVNRKALVDNLIFRGQDDRDPIPLSAVRWVYDGSGNHLPEGIFLIAGAHVQGFRSLDISLYDITPTMLWLLGFPAGADMPGRVFKEAFIEPLSVREPQLIHSWNNVVKQKLKPVVLAPDKKKLQQLQALGYIGN